MYIVDVDDFCESNNRLDLFKQIKNAFPEFKATVFTIMGRCSYVFIDYVKASFPWLDMVPHGLLHDTPRECENWTFEESMRYLDFVERFDLTKGFKAPGWQISDGMYQALLSKGYWVADQAYNKERRPKDIRVYLLNSPKKLHFHVQNVCNNGLEESMDLILSLKGEPKFGFIKDVI